MNQQNMNPQIQMMRKYIFEIMEDRYPQHDDIVERVASNLNLTKDMEAFGSLVTAIYEAGYRRAATEYQAQLKTHGLNISERIVDNSNPIFPK